MKSLRYLTTISALAISVVFASAQDPGQGRGRGGGGGKERDSGSSRQSSPPSSGPGRSSSSQDSGRSRDRTPPANPPASSGQSRDRDRTPPSNPPSNSGQSRDRDRTPPANPPSNSGQSRDRDRTPPANPPSNSGQSRDRTPPANPPSNSGQSRDRDRGGSGQDGGLGRDRTGGSSGSTGQSRDRDRTPPANPPSNSGQSRDRTPPANPPSNSGQSRDRDRQDGGLGRDRTGGSTGSTGQSRDRDRTPPPTKGGGTTGGSQNGGQGRDRGGSVGSGQLPGRGNDGGLGRGGSGNGGFQGRPEGRPSRSGSVNYQGNNNVTRIDNRVTITRPKTYGVIKTNSMEWRAQREDMSRRNIGLISNGWRTGYHHYNPNWCDTNFWYPHYYFSPFVNVNVVISPWYSYSFLPGYLGCDHVYVSNYRGYWGWNTGVVYVYDRSDFGSNFNRNRDLNYAIEDLQDGFERQNFRALERLVPDNGQIAIYRDGRYDYSIDSRDFEDLLNDLSTNANTDRYRILESRVNRDSARISAVHEYIDQWGNRQRVYHSIYLEMERGNMVIREFGTSDHRVW